MFYRIENNVLNVYHNTYGFESIYKTFSKGDIVQFWNGKKYDNAFLLDFKIEYEEYYNGGTKEIVQFKILYNKQTFYSVNVTANQILL